MAIAFTNLGSTASPDFNTTASAASATSGSTSPPTGLVLVFVHSDGPANVNAPTMTGTNGWNVTWTRIVCLNTAGSFHSQTLFAGVTSGGSAGTYTIDFGGQAQDNISTSVFYATGVDTSGGVAAAFVQTKTGSPTSTATPSITLDSTYSHVDNRCVAYFYNNAAVASSPRASWTEMDDWGGSSRSFQTQVRSDAFEQTGSATAASGTPNWFCLMAELKATVSAAPAPTFSLLGVS